MWRPRCGAADAPAGRARGARRTRRARSQGGRRHGGRGQCRGPGERAGPGQGGGSGGPPAGVPAVRHRVAGQLVAGPAPGHEPHHQGGGDRDHAGAVGPGDETREPEERPGRAAAQQAVHQPEDPRGVGRRVDDTPGLRGHARGQPGPVDARHYDHDAHVGRHGPEAEVESLPLIKERNHRVGRLRPASDYLEHDVNSQESYCAKSHSAVQRLRRDPGTGLHKDTVGSDQPNSYFRGQRNKRENASIVKQEMIARRDDRAAGRGRGGGGRQHDCDYDDGVEDPQPSV